VVVIRTLVNSMRSWKNSGLLDFVYEKVIILNDPLPQETAIALEFGFRIVEPKDVPNGQVCCSGLFSVSRWCQ
jgi:hypothetical protein